MKIQIYKKKLISDDSMEGFIIAPWLWLHAVN